MPDPDRSLADGAIAPWASGHQRYFQRLVAAVADELGIDLDAPFRSLTAKQRRALLYGTGVGKVWVRFRNRYGRERTYHANYEGVIPYLQRRHAEADSDAVREQVEGYMREVPCPACGGARLKPLSLAVTIGGHSIADICDMSIGEAAKVLASLELTERERLIAERVIKEINARMGFLLDVGLDYLTLSRSAGTLAGGEAQRIRLASQIGSGLVGVLYVLDEPSIGLHQRDNRRLIDTLLRLRDLGTRCSSSGDEDAIRSPTTWSTSAPAPASTGERSCTTARSAIMRNERSITGQYLSGARHPGAREAAEAERRLLTVRAPGRTA